MCSIEDDSVEEVHREDLAEMNFSFPVYTTPQEHIHTYLNTENKERGEHLLVDTGAAQNLVGSEWMQRARKFLPSSKEQKADVGWEQLNNPVPVGGVGNDVNTAHWKTIVPIALRNGRRSEYRALYLHNNRTPALLGTQSLRKMSAILDLREGEMALYCGDTSDIVLNAKEESPTYHRLNLEVAKSGHILLPCSCFDE